MERGQLMDVTAEIVSAHLSNNSVASSDVPALVRQVHNALSRLGAASEIPREKVPVVSVRASIKPDYLVCMECGKKQKMLRRHLMIAHNMTPEQYRSDYGLPRDYSMVARSYSNQRSEMAKAIGLGRKPSDGGKAASGVARKGRRTRSKSKETEGSPAAGGQQSTE